MLALVLPNVLFCLRSAACIPRSPRPLQIYQDRLHCNEAIIESQVSLPFGRMILFASLACIAHKSLEICERCRLWQQNSPAAPKNSTAFGEKSLAHLVSILLF